MRESPRDTIAAISTAAGTGAIAIVRMSGESALEIADAIFEGASLENCPSHTVHYGRVVDEDGATVDEVLATVMRAPRSYTTEDMVEFGCHGGDVPARRVLSVALASGARLARRGEFTERAFLAGRLDLVQAEAVADVVAARTRRGLEMALGQLAGSLSLDLAALRKEVLEFRAEIESLTDLPDEELPDRTRDQITAIGRRALVRVAKLLERCELGSAVRDGVSVAIVGRPNVGKSSLMNALLERDRSIVTPLPGTTRDAVEDYLHVSGVAVRLIDTAGWRDGGDVAEQAGVERAVAAARGADVVLFVVDGSRELTDGDAAIAAELEPGRTVVAVNKADLLRSVDVVRPRRLLADGDVAPCVRVSAIDGTGLPELRETVARAAVGCDPSESAVLTNVRHVRALRDCGKSVAAAVRIVDAGGEPTLAAIDLQEASEALGRVTGETTPEDVLEHIFERFCVGK